MKSLNELQQGAKEYFDADKKLPSILATADGQYFYPDKVNAATMHAREKGGLKVHTITRVDVMVEEVKAKVKAAAEASVVTPGETKTDYTKLKLDELKQEAEKRQLDTTGFEFKKHYIAALEAEDAAKAAIEKDTGSVKVDEVTIPAENENNGDGTQGTSEPIN